MIIGIIGTRRRDGPLDYNAVENTFRTYYTVGDWICSGGCPKGGDRFALILHKKFFTPYLEFPANWPLEGRSAGFVRNGDIAKHSDMLIACVAPDRTGGTEDTIRKFQQLKPEGLVITV